jgi:hypothetical protein
VAREVAERRDRKYQAAAAMRARINNTHSQLAPPALSLAGAGAVVWARAELVMATTPAAERTRNCERMGVSFRVTIADPSRINAQSDVPVRMAGQQVD